MYKITFLIRGSPALGTGSYSAVPTSSDGPNSESGSESDSEIDDVRKRDRTRRSNASLPRQSQGNANESGSGDRRRRPSSSWHNLRRSSSNTSDIGMGLDSKTSFASGGPAQHEHRDVSSISGSDARSEEHTSELQSHSDLVCRLLLEKKKKK